MDNIHTHTDTHCALIMIKVVQVKSQDKNPSRSKDKQCALSCSQGFKDSNCIDYEDKVNTRC